MRARIRAPFWRAVAEFALRSGLGSLSCLAGPALLLVGLGLAGQSLPAQVPSVINYQGKVRAGGADFNGVGQFKFALVSGSGAGTLWSNDGSSSGGAEPNQPVAVAVTQGVFSVFLGDTSVSNMTPVSWAVFTNGDVRLRIWFNDGTNGFARLSPDQRLGATGYAMMAANLPDGALTGSKLAPGAVQTQNIADGAVTSAQLAAKSVTIPAILDGAVTASKLAAGSVTAAAIANGTVSQAKLNFQLGYINARNPPYVARGDGLADDTAAIQSALNDAGAGGGGIVFLPQGDYRILSDLVVPAQTTLSGIWRAPTAFAPHQGTTLLAVAGAGSTSGVPFITLQGDNSTLEGVTIYYPNQALTNPPIPYPWAIRAGGAAGGVNVTVQNVLLVNPYLGLDLATHPSAGTWCAGSMASPCWPASPSISATTSGASWTSISGPSGRKTRACWPSNRPMPSRSISCGPIGRWCRMSSRGDTTSAPASALPRTAP